MRTVDDLQPWAARALEEAYHHANRREKCSREDFSSGFLAALEWLKSTSSFRTEPGLKR
jgi:hypothetical protein